jgi:transcriptional regulator with XRE-family HTH domain
MTTLFLTMEKYIKEERLRLGLTQKRLGELLGVSNSFVSQLEKGLSALPMDKLPLLAMHGFDVQYLVTGVRSTNMNAVTEQTAKDEEWLEIKVTRLSETQRDVVKRMVSDMVQEMERANEREQKAREQALRAVNGNGKNPP